jgi:hypothetical protein
LVNEPYQKKYFFNPYNPPYQLEKPIGIVNGVLGPVNGSENKLYQSINQFNEKLKLINITLLGGIINC